MNNIKCKAKVKETRITYTYMYGNREYEIETPRTALNENVKDGQTVHVMIAIMAVEDELTVDDVVVPAVTPDD